MTDAASANQLPGPNPLPRQIWPEDFAARYRAKGYWQGESFGDMLRRLAATHGARIAVVGGDTRLSYAGLLAQSETAARGFLARGLRPGDRVVVQLPNIAEFFPAVFGLFLAGLIPVFALPAHRRTEIAHFIARAGARALVIADLWEGFDYRILAREIIADTPGQKGQGAQMSDDGGPDDGVPEGHISGGPAPGRHRAGRQRAGLNVVVIGDAQEFTAFADLGDFADLADFSGPADRAAPARTSLASSDLPEPVLPLPLLPETDPAQAYAADSDPAASDPAITDPGAADPAVTDPAVTDPGATDPGATDPARIDLPVTDPSLVAFLQISGGTTGLSKLIPRTHDDYIYSFRESAGICGLGPDSVYLCALPVAHNFPMSSPGVFGALWAGAKVVLSPNPAPATAFPLIEAERVTITGLVPPLALLWMQAAPGSTHDLSSLKVLGVGGAKFIPEAAARVRPTLGCTLQQVFGMAEGLVNYTRLDDPEEIIINTQGRPISPDDEVLVLDDEGQPVAPGMAGYLHTRGPYTIRAYHNEPAANARSFTPDGYYRTGDMVKQLPGGYLVVQGRAGDHINRAGEKISAEEIEDHLLAHPSVFDAAVVSIPDPYLGERSCAFIIIGPGQEKPKAAAIKAFVRGRGIAAFKVPDEVVFVTEFVTTAVGKISRVRLRSDLRARYLEEEAAK